MEMISDIIKNVREKAVKDLNSFDIPSEREEAWRYTDLKKLKVNLKPSDSSSISIECDNDNVISMDIMNAASRNRDLFAKYFSKLISEADKVSAFHFANLSDGAFVYVPKNQTANIKIAMENPNSHVILVAEENATVNYSEYLTGDENAACTDSTEIFAGENSSINFTSLQTFGKETSGFSIKVASLSRNATIKWNLLSAGGRFYRVHASTHFLGEGSSSETTSVFVTKDNQHIDITTNAYHNVPHTSNNIIAKGVLLDGSSAIYRGLIKIENAAKNTNSYLSDHMLLVGEESNANSIPSLQIDTGDVKASHGSTKGQIDEEQLFYLQSRGMKREDAEKMLVKGFLMPLLDKVADKAAKSTFEKIIGAIE